MAATVRVTPAKDVATIRPIVLDLGKRKAKAIKELKRGTGKLMGEVAVALDEVRSNQGEEHSGKELVPIMVIFRKKRKRSAGGLIPFMS